MSGVVGLLHYPRGEDDGLSRSRQGTPLRLYRRALAYRRNPRDPAYMAALLAEHYPEAVFASTGDFDWRDRARDASALIVLYPDAIGAGFAPIEREVSSLRRGEAPYVLTGRGRKFQLDPRTRRGLRLRRLLETSMLIEGVSLLVLAVATPALLAWDHLRGRR